MEEKVVNTDTQKEIKRRKRAKAVKRIIKTVVILAVLGVGAFFAYKYFFDQKPIEVKEIKYTEVVATRRDIKEELSGSGTLESADSYTLSSRVSGEILSDTFAEGDIVYKDDVLYVIDSSDVNSNIKRANNTYSQSLENYNEKVADRKELVITAPISGTVIGLNHEKGDTLNTNSPVLTIKNTSTLVLKEYYSVEYMDTVYVGMGATVSVPGQMLNVRGTVSGVSKLTRVSETGVICFSVTVEIANPGSLYEGIDATAWLDGGIYPTITSTDGLAASAIKEVFAGVSGDIEKLNVENGDTVTSGYVLIELSSDTLEDEIERAADSLEDAQISIDNLNDTLSNYTIKAPINGTVVRKALKAGESAENGATLCMIYDLSYLTVTLAVDELDIMSVSVGQKATITADAVEGRVFDGVVTRVGVNGTTSGGVTTYPVDVRIDETNGLLPGMNVDISITVKEAANVVSLPTDAVARGNKVLVKTADGSTGEGAPDGFEYVTVEIGMADEYYVEIVSGVNEGDTVTYISRTVSSSNNQMNMMMPSMGGMMGGMGGMSGMGGSRPSGNMGGMGGSGASRPSGNMGGSRSGGGF